MDTITGFKKQFTGRKGIHFNSAGQAPVSTAVANRAREVISLQEEFASFADPALIAGVDQVRSRLADFLGADQDHTGFVSNVATALSQAALGFPLKSGDEVVTLDQEYASSFYPWRVACERSGATLRVFHSDSNGAVNLDELVRFIGPRTKVVAVSWVQFQTGTVLDLQRLGNHCRAIGAFLVVDGIQALGQLSFSLRDLPVDFIAGGAHKWMCSLLGQGFFAGTPEFLAQLSPVVVGAGTFGRWGTFADPGLKMVESSRKFEPGGFAFAPLFALDSAIQVLNEATMPSIEVEITRLSQKLRAGLRDLEVELATPLSQQGGTTSVKLDPTMESRFLERCKQERIALAKRGKYVRFSLHAFCNEDEIERVLQVLKEVKT
jgi:selenocysteine lyase/cysteine desulfurase